MGPSTGAMVAVVRGGLPFALLGIRVFGPIGGVLFLMLVVLVA